MGAPEATFCLCGKFNSIGCSGDLSLFWDSVIAYTTACFSLETCAFSWFSLWKKILYKLIIYGRNTCSQVWKFIFIHQIHTETKLLPVNYVCYGFATYKRMLFRMGAIFLKLLHMQECFCRAWNTNYDFCSGKILRQVNSYVYGLKTTLEIQVLEFIFTMNVFWELVVSLRFLLRMDGIDLPLVDSIWWCENSNIRASSILWHLFCGNFLLCQVTLGARYCCQSVSSWFVAFN